MRMTPPEEQGMPQMIFTESSDENCGVARTPKSQRLTSPWC